MSEFITTLKINQSHIADIPDYNGDDNELFTEQVIDLCNLITKQSGSTPSGVPTYYTRLDCEQIALLLPIIQSEIIDKYVDLADSECNPAGRREYRAVVRYWQNIYKQLSLATIKKEN